MPTGDTPETPLDLEKRVGKVVDMLMAEDRRLMAEDRRQTAEVKRMIYGYWETTDVGPIRVPGILEQGATAQVLMKAQGEHIQDIFLEMQKRDDARAQEWVDFKSHVSQLSWTIAKPLIAGLSVLVFVSIMQAATRIDWTYLLQHH